MGDEAEKEAESKKSAGILDVLVWLGMILAVYVLSVGPVVKVYDGKKAIPPNSKLDRFVDVFYAPLEWAYMRTPLHKPLGMYLHLWSNRFDRNGDLL